MTPLTPLSLVKSLRSKSFRAGEDSDAWLAGEIQKLLEAERDVIKVGIASIKEELNELAMLGAKPLWNSLIARLDDLEEMLNSRRGEPS